MAAHTIVLIILFAIVFFWWVWTFVYAIKSKEAEPMLFASIVLNILNLIIQLTE
jgi:hypothetical protein|nr:MAG TPA: hypothetical protein [Caudoviricetes sp.]DAQ91195.1 MAG TPA: hypothetical protein [Caudoviricetes sp.]